MYSKDLSGELSYSQSLEKTVIDRPTSILALAREEVMMIFGVGLFIFYFLLPSGACNVPLLIKCQILLKHMLSWATAHSFCLGELLYICFGSPQKRSLYDMVGSATEQLEHAL